MKSLATSTMYEQILNQSNKDDQTEELIKKLVLLIGISNLEYHTINQNINTIYDAYLAKIGKYDQIGLNRSVNQITVNIPII